MSLVHSVQYTGNVAGAYFVEGFGKKGGDWLKRHERYTPQLLDNVEDINEARRLATTTFVELGKIDSNNVGPDGLLKYDKFLEKSLFFGLKDNRQDGKIVATARLIYPGDNGVASDMRLPIEKLSPSGQRFVEAHTPPGQFAECGALAKDRGEYVGRFATLRMLREMIEVSYYDRDIKYWYCGLEPKVYPTYRTMFGSALTPLTEDGETIEFPGIIGQQVPLCINLQEAYKRGNELKVAIKGEGGLIRTAVEGLTRAYMVRNAPHVKDDIDLAC